MKQIYVKGHFSDFKRNKTDLINSVKTEYVITVKNTQEELDLKKFLSENKIKFSYNKLFKTFNIRPNSEKQEQIIEEYNYKKNRGIETSFENKAIKKIKDRKSVV